MKLITFLVLVLLIQIAFTKNLGKSSPKEESKEKKTFTPDYDVIILGAGASGMSSAVFLNDLGYDVLVLEKDNRVGGHCQTQYFTPPTPSQQNWMELGVQFFPDTAYENSSNIGSWHLGSRQFAQRFAPGTINYIPPSTLNYAYDFIHHVSGGGPYPSPPPTSDFVNALVNLETILATQYPWIENIQYPDPIPPQLLRPFGEFITNNSLQALSGLFLGLLYVGGEGDYTQMLTLYALQNVRRGILSGFSNPAAGFTVKEGCSSIYNGIVSQLGSQKFVLNAVVWNVFRSTNFVTVTYSTGLTFRTVTASKLIVSFPQLLQNLLFLDLALEEIAIFQNVVANYYYQIALNIAGPAANDTLNIASINVVNASAQLSTYPNILAVIRNLPYGPAVSYAYRLDQVPDFVMYGFVSNALNALQNDGTILNQVTITDFDLHLYQAHFTTASLSQSPTPYTKLNNIQGHRNTFWVGALLSYAETASIWEHTYNLITANFPHK